MTPAAVARYAAPVHCAINGTVVFHWAAGRLGVWGAKATTGPAQNSATLGVCQYLARFNEKVNVMTSSKLMPPQWRARFRSFWRAKVLTKTQPIESTEAARGEPLWHNGQLQTGRGVWESNPDTARSETVWKKWAVAEVHMVADITHEDGSFIAYEQLVVKLRLSRRRCSEQDYQRLTSRVTHSSVGGALEAGKKCETAWQLDQEGQRIWLCEDGEWYLYKPQDTDRFGVDQQYRQAVEAGGVNAEGMQEVRWSMRSEKKLVNSQLGMQLEQWSRAQLVFCGRATEPPDASTLVPCIAKHQLTKEHNALIEPAVWQGAVREWAAATADSISWLSKTGKVCRGKAAVLNAVRAAHAPQKAHLPSRAWECQGGPKPNWGRLFRALADMAMPAWVRDAAWSLLQGGVWWGMDRMEWSPETAVCAHCKSKGIFCIETATHFANCPRWEQLWKATQMVMETAGMPVVVRAWFVLYGPEAAVFRRDQYDTAVWIWATMVARMLQARRDSFEGSREPRNARQLVTGFRSVIYDAAAAEFAAATTWTAPFLSHAGRWGRRQARTMEDWRGRWRGIAQRQGHRMILFDSAEFDEGEAARLMTTHWQRGDQEVERRP